MSPRRLRGGVLAATFVLLAGCAGHAIAARPSPRPSPRVPLAVRIVLDSTTVVGGQKITGHAIVTNSTGHKLAIHDCHGGWMSVGLENADVSFEPAFLGCLSVPGTVFPPGVTRMPVAVQASYMACTDTKADQTVDLPACRNRNGTSVMPPLPPGTYHTKGEVLNPAGIRVPAPNSVAVTVTR